MSNTIRAFSLKVKSEEGERPGGDDLPPSLVKAVSGRFGAGRERKGESLFNINGDSLHKLQQTTPGIDKVCLTFSSGFSVKWGSGFVINPGRFDMRTGESTTRTGLCLASDGHTISGEGMYLGKKEDGTSWPFQVNIDSHGLRIIFNPSRYGEKTNAVLANMGKTRDVVERLNGDLREAGLFVDDLFQGRLNRVDISRDVETPRPFVDYVDVFRSLRMKRASRKEYANGFIFGNTQREFCTYDKLTQLAEVYNEPLPDCENILRGELRFLKGQATRNGLGMDTLAEFSKCSDDFIYSTYTHKIKDDLFRDKDGDTPILTGKDFQGLVEAYRISLAYGQRAKSVFHMGMAVRQIVELAGSLDKVEEAMRQAGMERTRRWRWLAEYERELKRNPILNLSDKFQELRKLFAA